MDEGNMAVYFLYRSLNKKLEALHAVNLAVVEKLR